jgi:predicted nucleotidyltransferase
MMSIEDKKILGILTDRIQSIFPGAKIWAFGSRARGDATWESDFDVCIVLPVMDGTTESKIRDISWEIGFEHDRVITTVIMEQSQFEHGPMSESTLVENILREGVEA